MTQPVILVPIDGSQDALTTLSVAKVLAEIERARVRIVHVSESKEKPAVSVTRLKLPEIDGSTIEARIGDPAEQILHLAAEMKPRLIVMCKYTAADSGKTLGSTAMKVLRNAPSPVVLVPPGRGSAPWHLHHVMVPHDGTPTTSAAVRPAAELAERAGAELLVAHVTSTGAAPSEPGSLTTSRYVDQPHHEWPVWTDEFVKRFACICPLGHLHVRMFLAHGDPAAQIVRLAKKQSMDLIVLAWRGKWEGGRAATLKEILRGAHCPQW